MIFFVADLFSEHYKGGAELTTEALISESLVPCRKILSSNLTVKDLENNKDSFWIFANYSRVSDECLLYTARFLNYSVIEYDYKFCKHRLPELHASLEGSCNCRNTQKGKLVSIFLRNAKTCWWMSQNQLEKHLEVFSFLNNSNNKVLSSVFSENTLEYIEGIKKKKKNDKWIIFKSSSWVKGTEQTIEYAKKNNLKYELLGGLEYKDFLNKLASAKGVVFHPAGSDTCPRMIIEAKLLGCELDLNKNVQHKDESWFATERSCSEYLSSRVRTFWDETEQYLDFLPDNSETNNNKYKIVVPFYNAEKYIKKCINSLKLQTHTNFECVLVDDISNDESAKIAQQNITGDERFKLVRNKEKKYALQNIYNCLKDGDDDEIVILLDGDDWLSSTRTLSYLNDVYNSGALVTFGSYVSYPYAHRGPEPSAYPQETIDNNSFRQDRWRASHLRTFKHSIWNNIKESDLKDNEGNFYDVAYDQAIMLPLLEMAGDKAVYIDKILHTYNRENPINVDKIKTNKQSLMAKQIRAKQKYERLQ